MNSPLRFSILHEIETVSIPEIRVSAHYYMSNTNPEVDQTGQLLLPGSASLLDSLIDKNRSAWLPLNQAEQEV